MRLFPRTIKGWVDYLGYAAGLVIGFGILSPFFDTIEASLRKKEEGA